MIPSLEDVADVVEKSCHGEAVEFDHGDMNGGRFSIVEQREDIALDIGDVTWPVVSEVRFGSTDLLVDVVLKVVERVAVGAREGACSVGKVLFEPAVEVRGEGRVGHCGQLLNPVVRPRW